MISTLQSLRKKPVFELFEYYYKRITQEQHYKAEGDNMSIEIDFPACAEPPEANLY